MLVHRYVLILIGVLAILPACRCNPLYCEDHPGHNCDNPIDSSTDGRERCMMNSQCMAPAAVCDITGSMTCVQCTTSQADACVSTTPVCGADNACRPCAAHAECAASNACLPDGSCASEADVAYVAAAGSGASCTKMMPCKKVSDAVNTNRPYVKFQGAAVINEQVMLNGKDVTILADPGAKLTDTSNGILLRIDGASHVSIYDLEISGASGATNPGISLQPGNAAVVSLVRVTLNDNQGGGISMTGGSLTVTQSTISSTTSGIQGTGISATGGSLTVSQSLISGNRGGIFEMDGTFVVVGNVFFDNGGITSSIGGIAISTASSAMNRLEFNTFAQNSARDGIGPGVQCTVGTFTARNNILSDNRTATGMEQVGGTCSHIYSISRPGALPPGTGNKASDPLFANLPMADLHLQMTSPARGAADPATDLTGIASHDTDGTVRVAPADIGAYQYK